MQPQDNNAMEQESHEQLPDTADKPAKGEKARRMARKYVRKTLPAARYLDKAASFINPRSREVEGSPHGSALGPIRFGMWTVLIIFGVFGIWSAFAPLSSAAIAMGEVVLHSNKKTIQHLEGGIIEEILVEEGSEVQQGDPLVRLSETAARARLELLRGQFHAAKAAEARLIAERDGLEEVVYPPEITENSNSENVQEIVDSQNRLFDARKKALEGKIHILNQRIEQHKQEIEGLKSQEESVESQLKLIREEVEGVEKLFKQGNAIKPRLLALQRKEAELQGQRGEYLAMIARAQQSITEAELEIMNLENTFMNEVVKELRDTQVKISDLQEQLRASGDILDRIVITAPQSGIVTDLQFHTRGGVISPGGKVLDIVPTDDRLIVEAKVMPRDIDVVHKGLEARVRLTAYKTRHIPPLNGTVVHVSPDSFEDKRTGQTYYKARVEISQNALQGFQDEITLYPGMPADVLIVTGSKTVLSYLLDPLTTTFNRALREQ